MSRVVRICNLLCACRYIRSDGMIWCFTEHCFWWFICRAGGSISAEKKRWEEAEKGEEEST
jgi:hypothetical protein